MSTSHLLLVALALGCAPLPPPPAFAGVEPIPEDKGRVYVYRPSGSVILGNVDFVLDGRPLATLGSDEYVAALLSPGQHMVAADPSFNLSGLALREAQTFRVRAGEPVFCGYYAEMLVDRTSIRLECSDDADAHGLLRDCRLAPFEEDAPWQP